MEVTTRELEAEASSSSRAGSPDTPVDESTESVSVQIEVIESGEESASQSEEESEGRPESQEWEEEPEGAQLIGNPTDWDSILRRAGIESIASSPSNSASTGEGHFDGSRSWSVSVNRLDRRDVRDISPERRPIDDRRAHSLPDQQYLQARAHPVEIQRDNTEQAGQEVEVARQVEGEATQDVQEAQEESAALQEEVPEEEVRREEQPVGQVTLSEEPQVENPGGPAEVPAQGSQEVREELEDEVFDMDEAQYRVRCRSLEDCIVELDLAKEEFTAADVNLGNFENVHTPLNEIKEAYTKVKTEIQRFLGDINRDEQQDWYQEWMGKLKAAQQTYKANERAVMAKRDEFLAAKLAREAVPNPTDSSSTNSSQESNESIRVRTERKAQLKRAFIIDAIKDLNTIMRKVGRPDRLEDHQVAKYLKDSSKWIIEQKAIKKETYMLKDMTVDHPLPSDQLEEIDTLNTTLAAEVDKMVQDLETEDSNRKLYTMAQSSSKESVPYPMFRSKEDEDVHKFIAEFKDALVRNQVPRKDQVKILRTYLKNFAYDLVHKDVTDIDKAYDILTTKFGNSEQVFTAKYRILLAECDRKWPALDVNPKEAYQRATKVLTQLEDLEKLIAEESVNQGELFNVGNVKKLYSVMPNIIEDKALEMINAKSTNEAKVKALKKSLEMFQQKAEGKMSVMLDEKEKVTVSAQSHGSRDKDNQQQQQHKCFICKKDWKQETHIREWNVFGCPMLLKMTSEERKEDLKKRKICHNCGSRRVTANQPDPGKHKCRRKIDEIKCAEDNCSYNGLVCYHKKVDPEVKKKVKEKLKMDLEGFNTIIEVQLSSPKPEEDVQASETPAPDVSHSIRDRIDDLQTGVVARQMSDRQVHDWFKMREEKAGRSVEKVLGIPEGETVFIFCIIKGRTRGLRAFIDNGCSTWLTKDGIPEKELKSVKLRDGPIPMWVAGGHTVYATAEWASLLPLSNGYSQVVRGLSTGTVTGPFGDIDMSPIMDEIRDAAKNSTSPGSKIAFKLKAPAEIKGEVDMLIGSKYMSIHPEPVFTTPEGLTLFKSKFLPNSEDEIACVGGPSVAFSKMVDCLGVQSVMSMMARISEHPETFSIQLEFFPTQLPSQYPQMAADGDLPELDHVVLEDQDDVKETPLHPLEVVSCKDCGTFFNALDTDVRKFLDINDLGLRCEYRCPTCRNCINCRRGELYEKVSFKQEEEQCIIRKSVWLDDSTHRPMAKLPFRVEPDDLLKNNRGMAMKMLDRVCGKYCHDKEVVEMIEKAFRKLINKGHMKFWEELTSEEKRILMDSKVAHYIPWDVAFSGSISTPARPTFNASKNTPNGTNLNDVLAKGIPSLVSLLEMILGWMAGPAALSGDISQFYNCVQLYPPHLPYQRFLFKPSLDPKKEAVEGVIRTLIYGVRSVAAQTEEVVSLIAEEIMMTKPDVANFLLKCRYVDDMSKGMLDQPQALLMKKEVDSVFERYGLKVKGWAVSGMKPPEEISKDGQSVSFAGMRWEPELDMFSLNHTPLHFGVKVRGRFGKDVCFFDAKKDSLEEFVPDKLTRRMISSKLMARYDPTGRESPLTLKFKFDLRMIVKNDPEWDAPVPPEVRAQWVRNFAMMEETRSFIYQRSVVPIDAVNPKQMEIWVAADAAERGGLIVGAWSSYLRSNGEYSCSQLIGRGLLANLNSTPKLELHALSTAANLKSMLERALEEWVAWIRVCSDSEISLSWVMYENNKLDVFTRNRVNNVRAKVSLDELHWIEGKENPADIGTRPDTVSAITIHPNSEWMCGKPWMRLGYEEALSKGIVKKAKDVKLDQQSTKKFKEGLAEEAEYEREVKGFLVRQSESSKSAAAKVVKCEAESSYVYPPLKYRFRRTVRTIACVLLAIRKFKLLRLEAKARDGIDVKDQQEELNQKTKFRYFAVDEKEKAQLKEQFNVTGFSTSTGATADHRCRHFILTEESLSVALEYLYRKASSEVRRYVDKKKVMEIAAEKEGVLYFKSRVLDKQRLSAVGGLEDMVDVSGFGGLNFSVPVLYRFSPLSISIAQHMHYEVFGHKGYETCYRLSIDKVYIMQGRGLFRAIGEDCVKCKKMRKKFLEVEMGALHDSQITVSPIFFATMVDCFGPLKCYCPGYERVTRGGEKTYKVWMMVFCCMATGTINVQVVETQDTDGLMTGFNRFFAEETVPKFMFPDKGSSLLKSLQEMEGAAIDMEFRLSEQRGIAFKACLPQGHSAHGRVERVIRSLQESLEAAEVPKERLTATGWQTVAKGIQNAYNSLPLGTYYRRGEENVSIMDVLTPNLLKGKVATRAPAGLFEVERDIGRHLDKVQTLFRSWYQVWNTLYLPQLLLRSKWFQTTDQDIKEDTIVLFKKTESAMSIEWVLGKVEAVRTGRDGLARECVILYKSTGETDRMQIVERPIREVVRLFDVGDTNLLQDIDSAREIAKDVLQASLPDPNTSIHYTLLKPESPHSARDFMTEYFQLRQLTLDQITSMAAAFETKDLEDDCYEWLQDCSSTRTEDDPLYFI